MYTCGTPLAPSPSPQDEMLVCTVGEMRVKPGASNVISAQTEFSVDIRAKVSTMHAWRRCACCAGHHIGPTELAHIPMRLAPGALQPAPLAQALAPQLTHCSAPLCSALLRRRPTQHAAASGMPTCSASTRSVQSAQPHPHSPTPSRPLECPFVRPPRGIRRRRLARPLKWKKRPRRCHAAPCTTATCTMRPDDAPARTRTCFCLPPPQIGSDQVRQCGGALHGKELHRRCACCRRNLRCDVDHKHNAGAVHSDPGMLDALVRAVKGSAVSAPTTTSAAPCQCRACGRSCMQPACMCVHHHHHHRRGACTYLPHQASPLTNTAPPPGRQRWMPCAVMVADSVVKHLPPSSSVARCCFHAALLSKQVAADPPLPILHCTLPPRPFLPPARSLAPLQELASQALREVGPAGEHVVSPLQEVPLLVSGAGHDAMAIAEVAKVSGQGAAMHPCNA